MGVKPCNGSRIQEKWANSMGDALSSADVNGAARAARVHLFGILLRHRSGDLLRRQFGWIDGFERHSSSLAHYKCFTINEGISNNIASIIILYVLFVCNIRNLAFGFQGSGTWS